MRNGLLFLATALAVTQADGERVCGSSNNASSTYEWHVGAGRYDGPGPGQSDGTATVALSIVPGTSATGTFFECVAEWPGSWAGWYEGGNIVWSDCIWAGNGQTYDTAVSFAMDWKNHTMYISHTFACSDIQGSDALATGSVQLDMDCTSSTDDSEICMLKGSGLAVTTKGGLAHVETDACADDSQSYQSWQLENWQRQYELIPGSSSATPDSDTGPSFTLKNMANKDVFDCSTSGSKNSTFDGTCQAAPEGNSTTTAEFHFDSQLDILTITQHWNCSDSSSLDATGIGYVQATCERAGNMLSCSSAPLWIGTKTV
ncbi:hypothetical protein F4781DRAFT_438848 [Annulohypoxylon bovei var. microspora]|nr:hypothetical protein F4781DRAFT_438848 [Annulohypoxylon bovei var. microspora]